MIYVRRVSQYVNCYMHTFPWLQRRLSFSMYKGSDPRLNASPFLELCYKKKVTKHRESQKCDRLFCYCFHASLPPLLWLSLNHLLFGGWEWTLQDPVMA